MECIYVPEIKSDDKVARVTGDEFKHLKALRMNKGGQILITNGFGITATGTLEDIAKKEYLFILSDFQTNLNESKNNITLAIGILDSRDRLEFAVEKAVELGVVKIIPLITEYAQQKRVKLDRLNAKAVAAMKQCKRSVLPEITIPVKFKDFIKDISDSDTNIIVCDINGEKELKINENIPITILSGPEGGFSENELEQLKSLNSNLLKLSGRRLRTETSVISALSIIESNNF